MSGSQVPPGGFRWVQPGADPPAPPVGKRWRWWWIAAGVVIVVAAAGIIAVATRDHLGGPDTTTEAHEPTPPIGAPADRIIPFALDRPLVPGWQKTATDVGLPAGTSMGVMITSADNHAYFFATTRADHCPELCPPEDAAWIYGIDTGTGEPLFTPIELPGFHHGVTCYGNGPATVICLSYKEQPHAWVIDLDHAEITYSGPSNVGRLTTPPAVPLALGAHDTQPWLVAVADNGVYGVDSHAQRSWFRPGDGLLNPRIVYSTDAPPPLNLATQGQPRQVFSLVDGTDLTPTPPPGTTIAAISAYNGGFAIIARPDNRTDPDKVMFYNTDGEHQSTAHLTSRARLLINSVMPAVLSADGVRIFTYTGQLVAQFPIDALAADATIVGTTFYINTDASHWQAWDLLTEQPGPNCDSHQLNLDDYIGANTTTIIVNKIIGYKAVDIATCHTLWETPDPDYDTPGKDIVSYLWKAGTTLIQRTGPASEYADALTSLRPPD